MFEKEQQTICNRSVYPEWRFTTMLKDGKTCSFGHRRFLPFGNFDVNITVPADHVMETTGG
jgi:hypothetical protein